jgi:hypothetical protein
MFNRAILRLALASVNVTPDTANSNSLFSHKNKSGTPRVSGGRISKCRKAKSINKYSSSSYRPHVLASDQLRFWSSPYTVSRQNAIISHIPATISANLMDVMLVSLEEKTRSNYGAGLLRFTQFCDTHGIAEADRCPASEVLISAFIASYAGLRSSDCINSWLSGIKWWHIFQGAEWYGGNMLATVKKGVAKFHDSICDMGTEFVTALSQG